MSDIEARFHNHLQEAEEFMTNARRRYKEIFDDKQSQQIIVLIEEYTSGLKELIGLFGKVATMTSDIKKLKQSAEDTNKKAQQNNTQCQSLKEQAEKELEKASKHKGEMTIEFQEKMMASSDQWNTKTKELEGKFKAMEDKLGREREEEKEKMLTSANIQEQLQSMSQTFGKLAIDQNTMDTMKERLQTAENQSRQLQEDLRKAKELNGTITQEKNVIEQENSATEKERDTLLRQKTALEEERDALSNDKSTIKQERDALSDEKSTIEKEKEQLELAHNTKLSGLEEEKKALVQQKEELEGGLAKIKQDHANEITRLETERDDFKNNGTNTQAQLDLLKQEIEGLRGQSEARKRRRVESPEIVEKSSWEELRVFQQSTLKDFHPVPGTNVAEAQYLIFKAFQGRHRARYTQYQQLNAKEKLSWQCLNTIVYRGNKFARSIKDQSCCSICIGSNQTCVQVRMEEEVLKLRLVKSSSGQVSS